MRIYKVKHGGRKVAEATPGFVYCGRMFGGFEESPLANPFRARGRPGHKADAETFEELLTMYEAHLLELISHDGEAHKTMAALTPLSALGCWCVNKKDAGTKPWRCHCDVIADVWDRYFKPKES